MMEYLNQNNLFFVDDEQQSIYNLLQIYPKYCIVIIIGFRKLKRFC